MDALRNFFCEGWISTPRQQILLEKCPQAARVLYSTRLLERSMLPASYEPQLLGWARRLLHFPHHPLGNLLIGRLADDEYWPRRYLTD
jgi:hypothetical protein